MTGLSQLGITPEQSRCLAAIRRLTVDGVPPSYRELQAELRLGSVSSVHRLIEGLEHRGRIETVSGVPRSLRIIEGPTAAQSVADRTQAELVQLANEIMREMARRYGAKGTATFCRNIASRLEGNA